MATNSGGTIADESATEASAEAPSPAPVEVTDPRLLPPSPPWSAPTKLAVAVGLVVFAAIIFWMSRDALPIVAVAGIVAFLVAPMVRFLHRRLHLPRWIALVIGYVVVLVVSLTLIAILAIGITQSLAGINLDDMQDSIRSVAEWFVDWGDGLVVVGISVDMSEITTPVNEWLAETASEGTTRGGIKIDTESLQAVLGGAFNSIRTVTGLVTAAVVSALITVVIAVYLNADSGKFYRWLHRSVPPGYERDGAMLADRTGAIWRCLLYTSDAADECPAV